MKTFLQRHRRFSMGALSCLLLTVVLLSALLIGNIASQKPAHAAGASPAAVTPSDVKSSQATFTVAAKGPFPYVWTAPAGKSIRAVQLTPPGQTYHDGSDAADVICPNASSSTPKQVTINAVDGDDPNDPQLSGSCTYQVALCHNVSSTGSINASAADECPLVPCEISVSDPASVIFQMVSVVTVTCTEPVTLIIIEGGTFYKDTKATAPGYGTEIAPKRATKGCRLTTTCELTLNTASSGGYWSSSASAYVLGYGNLPTQYSPHQINHLL